jgi:hypothetical protein
VGLLRGAGPSDVPTVPRRRGLLVRLLRRLQRWELRPRAGVLRHDHQRPSKRRQRLATERFPPARELDHASARGQALLPPHCRGGPTSTRSWLKRASLKPSLRKSTAQCDCFEPPSPGKPPRAANARVSWAGKPASASTPTATSMTRPRERARSSLPLQHCYRPCRLHQRPRSGTCTARCRRSSSKRAFSRLKARHPASASRGARGTTGARKAPNHRYTQEAQRNVPPTQGARRSRSGSLIRAGTPKMATPATSSTPGGRATRRRGQRQATTPDGVGAMTAGRTAHRRRGPGNPRVQPGDPHDEFPLALPPAHVDRQVQQGDGPPRMAQ